MLVGEAESGLNSDKHRWGRLSSLSLTRLTRRTRHCGTACKL